MGKLIMALKGGIKEQRMSGKSNNNNFDMTNDLSLATGFRIYENVKHRQNGDIADSNAMHARANISGIVTTTYHGKLFRNRTTGDAFGEFRPLPESLADRPGYHSIIEMLFPNGQSRRLTQAETIEFWANVFNLGEEDDLPLFKIKYQLDQTADELMDLIQDGELGSLVFEFDDINNAFKSGKSSTYKSIKQGGAFANGQEITELVLYPARGRHEILIDNDVQESDELLISAKIKTKTLIDESIKEQIMLPIHKATKSTLRRPGRIAKSIANKVAKTVAVTSVEEAPIKEQPAEIAQTNIAMQSADIANSDISDLFDYEEEEEYIEPFETKFNSASALLNSIKTNTSKSRNDIDVDNIVALYGDD